MDYVRYYFPGRYALVLYLTVSLIGRVFATPAEREFARGANRRAGWRDWLAERSLSRDVV
jgi:hypothetical protein